MKRLLNRVAAWVSWHRRLVGSLLAGISVLMVGSALAAPSVDTQPAVVAARELPAGHALTAHDLQIIHLPAEAVPGRALPETQPLVGRTTAVALSEGSILQPTLLAASRSTEPGRALVPVTLHDDGLRVLLTPGDKVTLIAAGYDEVQVLSTDARVAVLPAPVASSGFGGGGAQRGSMVLMDVPQADAAMVAAIGQDGGIRLILGGQ